MALSKEEKTYLLKLARKSIEHYFRTGKRLELSPQEVPSKALAEDGACFVTLYTNGQLRGCIGSLEAHRPLVMDVIDNALHAAFGDPRFPPLSPEELPRVKISISLLTKPEPFRAKSTDDLLNGLIPGKHGLIIKKGYARATFLPAVWEQIPDKQNFLGHLCAKAGLHPDEWRDTSTMEFFVYYAEEFSEE